MHWWQEESEATELHENGGIHLLQRIIKIKEIGHNKFEIIFAFVLYCWHVTELFIFSSQTPLAPPEVQQQYLSSIQHLLGDGMMLIIS